LQHCGQKGPWTTMEYGMQSVDLKNDKEPLFKKRTSLYSLRPRKRKAKVRIWHGGMMEDFHEEPNYFPETGRDRLSD
ncbi:hypothetical protein Tco_1288523, partial [Tanacetum coccineum]